MVEPGFLLEQLLDIQFAIAEQSHGGFQLGVKSFFFFQALSAAFKSILKGLDFEFQTFFGIVG